MKNKYTTHIKIICIIFSLVIIVAFGFVSMLHITEYRPNSVEDVTISGTGEKALSINNEISLISWNIGYAGLDSSADFFMDGGKDVWAKSKDAIESNVSSISNYLKQDNSDIVFLQEIDVSSTRSFYFDELSYINDIFTNYNYTYAPNFRCIFVPYPLPPLGKMETGITTFSKYQVTKSERYSLPNPFSWPLRLANLKRCLLVNRYSIEDSDKELVAVNLHLEAYDSGEGKIAQTKALCDLMEKEYQAGNYVIVGGDFNQTFSNIDISRFDVKSSADLWQPGVIETSEFSKHFVTFMDDKTPSCRSLDKPYDINDENFQYYIIDGFMVSDNIEVLDAKTQDLEFENSDHNPVKIRIKLK